MATRLCSIGQIPPRATARGDVGSRLRFTQSTSRSWLQSQLIRANTRRHFCVSSAALFVCDDDEAALTTNKTTSRHKIYATTLSRIDLFRQQRHHQTWFSQHHGPSPTHAETTGDENNSSVSPSVRSPQLNTESSLTHLKRFDQLGLDVHFQSSLESKGFVHLTEVQRKTWETILTGKDLIARAHTGTGKTLAFLLPTLERLERQNGQAVILVAESTNKSSGETSSSTSREKTPDVKREQVCAENFSGESKSGVKILVISPTRELATQTGRQASMLVRNHPKWTALTVYGGRPKRQDMMELSSGLNHPVVLVATPGRLLDHLQSTSSTFNTNVVELCANLQTLILDEMDTLLDMGFRDTLEEILEHLPSSTRQTLLFSATFPVSMREMMSKESEERLPLMQQDFVLVDCVDEDSSTVTLASDAATAHLASKATTSTRASIHQSYVVVPVGDLVWSLIRILDKLVEDGVHSGVTAKIMVFFPTTAQVQFFARLMNHHLGRRVLEMHAELRQNRRTHVSDIFRSGSGPQILLTSDVSARGMDYPHVTHVVQVGMAKDTETYVHRTGRTGRGMGGQKGEGILVLLPPERLVLERELAGFPLLPNQHLQDLVDRRNLTPDMETAESFLEEDQMRLRSELQQGQLKELTKDAHEVYRSLLGYHFSKLRQWGVRYPQETVVEIITQFLQQLGVLSIPPIPKRLVEQYGLTKYREILVRTEWQGNRTFRV